MNERKTEVAGRDVAGGGSNQRPDISERITFILYPFLLSRALHARARVYTCTAAASALYCGM